MEKNIYPLFTTAFVGITLSGELYIIEQHQGSIIECARWRKDNREKLERLYGEIQTVTIRHKEKD